MRPASPGNYLFNKILYMHYILPNLETRMEFASAVCILKGSSWEVAGGQAALERGLASHGARVLKTASKNLTHIIAARSFISDARNAAWLDRYQDSVSIVDEHEVASALGLSTAGVGPSAQASAAGSITVRVQFSSQILPISVVSCDTIGDLKAAISRALGIPAARQRVIVRGGEPAANEALVSAGIHEQTVVMLVDRNPSGSVVSAPKRSRADQDAAGVGIAAGAGSSGSSAPSSSAASTSAATSSAAPGIRAAAMPSTAARGEQGTADAPAEYCNYAGAPFFAPMSGEKREHRFRPAATMPILERMHRATQQRLLFVDRRQLHQTCTEFKVLGSTGNPYTVTFDRSPRCNCPDGQRGNHCKHLLYVKIRVLKIPHSCPLLWQDGYLSHELQYIFAHAPDPRSTGVAASAPVLATYQQLTGASSSVAAGGTVDLTGDEHQDGMGSAGASSSSSSLRSAAAASRSQSAIQALEATRRQPAADDDCVNCYDTLGSNLSLLTWCTTCGNNFHAHPCFDGWRKEKTKKREDVTCPNCRFVKSPSTPARFTRRHRKSSSSRTRFLLLWMSSATTSSHTNRLPIATVVVYALVCPHLLCRSVWQDPEKLKATMLAASRVGIATSSAAAAAPSNRGTARPSPGTSSAAAAAAAGAGSPLFHSREGYLNFASLTGQSSRRDTSTYSEWASIREEADGDDRDGGGHGFGGARRGSAGSGRSAGYSSGGYHGYGGYRSSFGGGGGGRRWSRGW